MPIKMQVKEDTNLYPGEDYSWNSYKYVNPFDISSYSTYYDSDSEVTSIKLKNGSSFFVYLTLKDFERKLNDWYSK